MHESTITIARCKATAAHGRRCMQTPFMTSPFCWHHTARADREALRAASHRGDDGAKTLADRIVGADLTTDQRRRIEQVLATDDVAA